MTFWSNTAASLGEQLFCQNYNRRAAAAKIELGHRNSRAERSHDREVLLMHPLNAANHHTADCFHILPYSVKHIVCRRCRIHFSEVVKTHFFLMLELLHRLLADFFFTASADSIWFWFTGSWLDLISKFDPIKLQTDWFRVILGTIPKLPGCEKDSETTNAVHCTRKSVI